MGNRQQWTSADPNPDFRKPVRSRIQSNPHLHLTEPKELECAQPELCLLRKDIVLFNTLWMDEPAFLFFLSTAALFCLHNRLSYFNSTPESIYVYCNHRWCWGLFLVGLVLKTKLFVISNINWSEGIRSSLGSLSNQTGIIRIPLHCWNPAVLFLSFCFSLFFLSLQRPSAWQSGKSPKRREVEEGRELQKEEGAPSSGCLEQALLSNPHGY